MGGKSARLSVDAIDHFAPVFGVPGVQAIDAFTSQGSAQTPMRVALGRDLSDISFVNEAVAQLEGFGVAHEDANRAIGVVLASPTISLQGRDGRILQAALVQNPDDLECMRVTLRARVLRERTQRTVGDLVIAAMPFDHESIDELAAVAVELAEEAIDYPTPNSPNVRKMSAAVFGKPQGGVAGMHPWNTVLKSLGRVLDIQIRIVADQQSAKDSLPGTTSDIFVLDPAFVSAAKGVESNQSLTVTAVTGREFRESCLEMAKVLIGRIVERAASGPAPRARKLKPGERVFHRKEKSSGAPFDRFGEPRRGCSHPVEGYVRYHKAPKAEKGMARLYTNFSSEMLYHCGKGYDCGMYAVFAPDNLS
ncbi:hypothetical protein ACIPY5_08970 [Microbacterium sp. NPDC089698]|uniref:hypothetical protein n=1 Tax=Microbacterium sp. NPDC089698 TaxID=3364200 RepID=UPI0038075504